MKTLLLFLFAMTAFGQFQLVRQPDPTTVASLPTASSNTRRIYIVTDGLSASDCTTGGGSTRAICISNGTTWTATAGGSGSITGCGTGMTLNGTVCDVNTAVIPSNALLQGTSAQICRSTTGNDTYTCALNPTATSLGNGTTSSLCVVLNAGTSNTGASTLNVDTLGAKALQNADGTDATITAGKPVTACYDGTQFVVQGGGGGSSGTMTILEPVGKNMSSGVAGPGVSANQVIYWKFPVFATTTVRYYNAYPFSAKGVGTQGFALMNSSCSLVSGSTATVAAPGSTPIRADMGASITLTPGMYYIAYTSTSATDSLFGVSGDFAGQVANQGYSDPNLSYFSGATASASGVVPSSCGTQTGLSSSQSLFFVRLNN